MGEVRVRSGRQARQAERAHKGQGHGRPYIVRNIPTYDVLSEENLVKIEAAADRVLARDRIEFRDDRWRWITGSARGPGLRAFWSSSNPACCAKSCARPRPSSPSTRATGAFGADRGKNVVFSPAYGSPFVMDLDRGRRFGTIEDFRNFIKLAQSSPNFHNRAGRSASRRMCGEQAASRHGVGAYRTFGPAFHGSVTAEERSEDSIDMARIVFGEHL